MMNEHARSKKVGCLQEQQADECTEQVQNGYASFHFCQFGAFWETDFCTPPVLGGAALFGQFSASGV